MKAVKKTLSIVMAVGLCLSGTACAQPNMGSMLEEEKIDTKKTQIFVYNFNGGYGSDWLYEAKERFEELHKDDENWEEGKKGVQVYINPVKKSIDAQSILGGRDEIYFAEGVSYYDLLASNAIEDITDVVNADMAAYGDAAGTTLLDKFYEEQQSFYGVKDNAGKVHYYAVPHYASYMGITYNVEMFDKFGYYFKKDADLEGLLDDMFVRPNSDDEKSVGMDGIANTSDDGLPTTYEEFFLLCDYIHESNQTPFVTAGNAYKNYLTLLMQALAVDYEGRDQFMLNYNFDGTATDLGTVVNGVFVEDAADTTIKASNGYELARQAGKYYALEFIDKLTEKENGRNKYAYHTSFNSGYTHLESQEDFLYAGNDGGYVAPIGMLVDGIYWQNEAASTFTAMEKQGEEFSRTNRKFAFMPLPKANQAEVEKARAEVQNGGYMHTLMDYGNSLAVVKKGVAEWKKPLVLDFLKFVNSDESLVEFTKSVGVPKSLKYDMSSSDMDTLSPFTKSVYDLKQASDIVYPFANNATYIDNNTFFMALSNYSSTVSGVDITNSPEAFIDKNITAQQYFSGMYAYVKKNWVV